MNEAYTKALEAWDDNDNRREACFRARWNAAIEEAADTFKVGTNAKKIRDLAVDEDEEQKP
jgi:hypothetical protein